MSFHHTPRPSLSPSSPLRQRKTGPGSTPFSSLLEKSAREFNSRLQNVRHTRSPSKLSATSHYGTNSYPISMRQSFDFVSNVQNNSIHPRYNYTKKTLANDNGDAGFKDVPTVQHLSDNGVSIILPF